MSSARPVHTLGSMYGPATTRERLAGWFVLAVLAIACVAFWVGVPLGYLWALGKLTDSTVTHFVGGVLGVPVAMVLFSPLLFWLNGLYLRVTGTLQRLAEEQEESGWERRVRGPLEPMLFVCFVVAAGALLIWFFLIAKNPPPVI